jgi:hypothetical protein
MGLNLNSKIVTDGLVFAMDVANPKSINASGCVGYNNAPQLVKNLVSPSDTITATSNLKLGNLSYFTAFAIDYPESSYGGAAASRHGITPGFNVTSGSKEFQFGRSLHLWISRDDNGTPVTVKATTYDTYASSSEVDRFVTEYNDAKGTYRGSRYTYLVAGSHRDSNHSEAEYTALKDMGAPSNVGSIINNSSPEWILVGRPGIGAGNGAWSYQNYSTNPDQVAHLNFGVPFQGNSSNYLSFDGSSDYATIASGSNFTFGTGDFTLEAWYMPNVSYAANNGYIFDAGANGTRFQLYNNNFYFILQSQVAQVTGSAGVGLNVNTWYHAVGTRVGSTLTLYLNGVSVGTSSSSANLSDAGGTIGNYGGLGPYYFNGKIPVIRVYKNKGLSATEVQQNFNALRGRYGI